MSAGLRVLAVRPAPARETVRMDRAMRCEPLELEYLETVLTDPGRGPVHEVALWDGLVERGDLIGAARALRAQVVLFSAHVTHVPGVLAAASRLKALPEPPRVFVGGVHAEVLPEHFFAPSIDGVLFADALEGIARLLAHLARGEPYADLPGAAFPGPDGWVRNPGPCLDPAAIPIPRRSLLQRWPERYRTLYFTRCASVKTAFGCPAACTFCFCARMHGGTWGPRPVDAVADEIAGLPVENVFLVDDNLLTSPERCLALVDALRRRGVRKRLVAYGTADFVARHPEVIGALREVGLEALMVGLEFVTDEALEEVRKRATAADNEACIARCRALGIELFALFVVDPAWRHRDFLRLARWVVRQGLCFATFSTLTALPGTPLARQQGRDLPPARDLWRFDLLRLHQRPAHLSPAAYYLWLFLLYMLPTLRVRAARILVRRYGPLGALRFVVESTWTGVEYLVRLLRWR